MRTDYTRLRTELLDAHQRLGQLLELLPAAWTELIDNQPGYPTNTGGGGSGQLSDDGKPAGLDRHLHTVDPAADDLRTLRQAIIAAHHSATRAHRIAISWTAAPTTDTPGTPSRGSDCQCCGRWIAGTDTDRSRSGLCMSCYQDWRRTTDGNPHIERALWSHRRRARLAEVGDLAS